MVKNIRVGAHFSRHIRGMFLRPKPTIHEIISEPIVVKDLLAPFFAVVVAGIMAAIGANMWNIIVTPSIIQALWHTLLLTAGLFLFPVWFIFTWLVWTGILHFLGSVIAGKDVTQLNKGHKMLKLMGFCMVPYFLNILPFFGWFMGLWVWLLAMWAVQYNYELTDRGAFIAALPMLFVWIIALIARLGLL